MQIGLNPYGLSVGRPGRFRLGSFTHPARFNTADNETPEAPLKAAFRPKCDINLVHGGLPASFQQRGSAMNMKPTLTVIFALALVTLLTSFGSAATCNFSTNTTTKIESLLN